MHEFQVTTPAVIINCKHKLKLNTSHRHIMLYMGALLILLGPFLPLPALFEVVS